MCVSTGARTRLKRRVQQYTRARTRLEKRRGMIYNNINAIREYADYSQCSVEKIGGVLSMWSLGDNREHPIKSRSSGRTDPPREHPRTVGVWMR